MLQKSFIDVSPESHFPIQNLPFGIFQDRKSTRLNSSHSQISYAVFCLKKKNNDPLTTARTLAILPLSYCSVLYFVHARPRMVFPKAKRIPPLPRLLW